MRRGLGTTLLLALLLCAACRGSPRPAPPAAPPGGEEASAPASAALPAPAQKAQARPEPVPDPAPEGPSPPAPEPAAPDPAPEPDPEPLPEPEPVPERPANTRLYILMFHHFAEGDSSGFNAWTLTPDGLRENLAWLAEHGYETVLPGEIVGGEPLPDRAVLLTFDDGYESNYTLAYPVLQEFGAKAAISLVARWVREEAPGYLTWEECREMADSGLVEFGSHTLSLHEDGIVRGKGETEAAYRERVFPDLDASIAAIEAGVGRPVRLFAYPHGRTEPWASEYLEERFGMTVTTRSGQADLSRGRYDLPRCNISISEPVWKYLPD